MLRGHIKVATTYATISAVGFVWNMLQISYCTCHSGNITDTALAT